MTISSLKRVISVKDELLGETFSLFAVSKVSSWFTYYCMFAAAVSGLTKNICKLGVTEIRN